MKSSQILQRVPFQPFNAFLRLRWALSSYHHLWNDVAIARFFPELTFVFRSQTVVLEEIYAQPMASLEVLEILTGFLRLLQRVGRGRHSQQTDREHQPDPISPRLRLLLRPYGGRLHHEDVFVSRTIRTGVHLAGRGDAVLAAAPPRSSNSTSRAIAGVPPSAATRRQPHTAVTFATRASTQAPRRIAVGTSVARGPPHRSGRAR